jgi:tyrosine-protein kinase Etk/Wzc
MPQYELNLMDYWQIIYKRRLAIVIIFIVIFLASILYTQTIIPQYRATSSVMITVYKSLSSVLMELSGTPIGDPMVSYAEVAGSIPIIEEAVRQLGLAGKDATPQQVTEIAGSLQGAVSTEVQSNTSIITITVTHENAELTAELANKIAEVFIAGNLKEKSKQVRKVREFIENQVAESQKKLTNSENTLKEFKEKEAPSGIAVAFQEKLSALETEKVKLSKIYTNIYPDIIKMEEGIKELKAEMQKMPEAELAYARLRREVEINDIIYRELKAKLESARIAEAEKTEDVNLVDRAVTPNSPISPNKKLNYFLGVVIGLMLSLTGAFLFEQLDTSIGTIEDVENLLKLPVLGVIPYLKTEDEKNVGLIQRLWPKKIKGSEKFLRLRKQLLIHYPSSSSVFEAYRMLRTNIQTEVFKEKIQGKILLFSSAGPEEGKSITVSNLAIVMAQGGLQTLLIDADMRRSTIHKIFGLEKKGPGLCDILREGGEADETIMKFTDILLGELGFDDALKVPGLDNLNILTSGSSPTMPAELLSSAEMTAVLEKLRVKFDIILIDSPPVLAVADAVILASKADGVILVYRVGKTARSILARTKTQLIEAGAQVKGIVLNNISPQIEMSYGYYYRYKYYGGYYTLPKEKTEEQKTKDNMKES